MKLLTLNYQPFLLNACQIRALNYIKRTPISLLAVLRFLRRLGALLGLFVDHASSPISIRPESALQLREILDIANTVRDDFIWDWALFENLGGTAIFRLKQSPHFSFASF